MVDIITYAIFGDCRLRGVGVVRWVSLLSPIDLRCRPYNTCHTTVWSTLSLTTSDKCRWSGGAVLITPGLLQR